MEAYGGHIGVCLQIEFNRFGRAVMKIQCSSMTNILDNHNIEMAAYSHAGQCCLERAHALRLREGVERCCGEGGTRGHVVSCRSRRFHHVPPCSHLDIALEKKVTNDHHRLAETYSRGCDIVHSERKVRPHEVLP